MMAVGILLILLVFVDDDGQAYLYWGNPNIYYVKLNDDMISLKGEVRKNGANY